MEGKRAQDPRTRSRTTRRLRTHRQSSKKTDFVREILFLRNHVKKCQARVEYFQEVISHHTRLALSKQQEIRLSRRDARFGDFGFLLNTKKRIIQRNEGFKAELIAAQISLTKAEELCDKEEHTPRSASRIVAAQKLRDQTFCSTPRNLAQIRRGQERKKCGCRQCILQRAAPPRPVAKHPYVYKEPPVPKGYF